MREWVESYSESESITRRIRICDLTKVSDGVMKMASIGKIQTEEGKVAEKVRKEARQAKRIAKISKDILDATSSLTYYADLLTRQVEIAKSTKTS